LPPGSSRRIGLNATQDRALLKSTMSERVSRERLLVADAVLVAVAHKQFLRRDFPISAEARPGRLFRGRQVAAQSRGVARCRDERLTSFGARIFRAVRKSHEPERAYAPAREDRVVSGELVSVVIPTYNRAGLIARAIDSVLAQTHQTLEVVVVDDGSTDRTAELIKTRYGAEPRVRYLTQTNQGVSAARNRGLGAARGEYVALLDSDDVWKPWKLELQLCCFRAVPEAGMVWTDMEAIGPDGNSISRHYLRTMYQNSYRWFPETSGLFADSRSLAEVCPQVNAPSPGARLYWGDIYSQMIMGNLVHTSTVLLRRERLEQVRGFNEALKVSGEDYDFHLRTCREGPVAFADVSSIEYQVGRPDQLTQPVYAIHMARNFLATIAPALERDRERIRLPASMLAAVQAFAHGWIGMEHLELGEHAQARSYLRRSLHYCGWQPKIWVVYALSMTPPSMVRIVMRQLRRINRKLREFADR